MSNNTLHVPSNDDFVERWSDFFKEMEKTWILKISFNEARYKVLKTPFEHIISCLCSEEAKKYVIQELERFEAKFDSSNANVLIAPLYAEMEYVISICKNAKSQNEVSDALSSGKNVKDSLEKIFKLPEWLKKVLHILNELLSLVKS